MITLSEFHEQNNKSIVKRFYEEILNAGDFAMASSLIKAEFIDNSPAPGQGKGMEGLLNRVKALRTVFPDLKFTLQDLLADGDRVVAMWTFSGTLQGEFMGLTRTNGGLFSISGIDFFRMSESRLKERWQFVDAADLLKQTGLRSDNSSFVL